MRRIATCLAAAALAWPVAAIAKGGGGVSFAPPLSTLAPGHAERLQLLLSPLLEPGRSDVVRARIGSVPVVTLGSRLTSQVVTFRGTPLRHSAADHRVLESTVSIMLPGSTAAQLWDVSVSDDGRVFPTDTQLPLRVPASTAAPAAQSDRFEPWSWIVAAMLVAAAGGLGLATRRRHRTSDRPARS